MTCQLACLKTPTVAIPHDYPITVRQTSREVSFKERESAPWCGYHGALLEPLEIGKSLEQALPVYIR
jgi:hypothetical protein